MFLINEYPHVPGCCRMCQGQSLPAIDTEIFGEQGIHDWHWYICRACIQNMYVAIGGEDLHGVVAKTRFDEMESAFLAMACERDEANVAITDLEAQVKALRSLLTEPKENDGLARSGGSDPDGSGADDDDRAGDLVGATPDGGAGSGHRTPRPARSKQR